MGRIWRHIPKGLERALLIARQIVDGKAPEVPVEAAKIVTTLSQQALDIHVRLREIDRDLAVCLRGNDVARRLMTIPGIGPVGAWRNLSYGAPADTGSINDTRFS